MDAAPLSSSSRAVTSRPCRFCRVRHLEQARQELADALRDAHLRVGALPLALGAEVEHAARGQAGDERHEHDGRGDDRAAVPPHELPDAVAWPIGGPATTGCDER